MVKVELIGIKHPQIKDEPTDLCPEQYSIEQVYIKEEILNETEFESEELTTSLQQEEILEEQNQLRKKQDHCEREKTKETANNIEKSFSCLISKKQFTLQEQLTQHIPTHSGEERLSRLKSQKNFSFEKCLKQHTLETSNFQNCVNEFQNPKKELTLPFSKEAVEDLYEDKLKSQAIEMSESDQFQEQHSAEGFKLLLPKEEIIKNDHESQSKKTLKDGGLQRKESSKLFTCTKCEKRFIMKCHLMRHMSVHAKNFSTSAHLKAHLFIHKKNKKHSCLTVNFNQLKQDHCKPQKPKEASNNEENPFPFLKCENDFALQQHIPIESEEEQLSCLKCQKNFSSEKCLKQHMLLHDNKKSYFCYNCDKCFATKGNLKEHMFMHSKNTKFSCSTCGKCFVNRSKLHRHMSSIHSGLRPYACSKCGKHFSVKDNLAHHLRIHIDKRPQSCPFCQKCFNFKHHLKLHMLVHVKDKPYSCSKCEERFTTKNSLKIHMFIHKNKTQVSCSTCGKCFVSNYALKLHMITHTDQRLYSCTVCEKPFKAKGYLRQHMKTHTVTKPHSCQICHKSFNFKGNLKSHMLIHDNKTVLRLKLLESSSSPACHLNM